MNHNNENYFGVPGPMANNTAYSNVDYWYGPYDSIEDACQTIPGGLRKLGLTVGIIENNKVVEYLWKTDDLSDEGLKSKIEDYTLDVKSITYTTDTTNDTITFLIEVDGKGFGVQTIIYLGSNRIISEATILNLAQPITIKAPENPGNYVYTISVLDNILNNGTLATCEVVWKEVDVKVENSSPIYTYQVKSLQNLQNSSFSFLIYKIDSVEVSLVSIIFGESGQLILFNSEEDEFSSFYTVHLADLNVDLAGVDLQSGDKILVKIEGNISEPFIKEVVLLTAPGVFSSCEGIVPAKVYNNLSFSATLRFEAENIANYQVVIKDNDEDIIYNSSLLSYNTNTVTLTLSDSTLSEDKLSSQHILYVYIGESETYNYRFSTITLMYVPNTELLSDIDSLTRFLNTLDFNLSTNLSLTLQSYILDLSCYIPYVNTNLNLFLFANITINRDVIQFRGITYPTPLLLNISIGFMCNVKSSYLNEDYYYDALFINGILCYKNPSEGSPSLSITSESTFIDNISNKIRLYYNTESSILQSAENFVIERNYKSRNPGLEATNLPTFNITPLNNILTKADLTPLQIEQIVDNEITIDGIEYKVIDTTSYRVGTFGNLGDQKYLINDILSSFCLAYGILQQNDDDSTISKLNKAVKNDISKIPSNYLTLTRLIVKSKKLLLKYVAVPCMYEYQGRSGYLLAFTLGTSTLEYALPNFTFKFFSDDTFSTKSSVSLIPKINRNLSNLLNYSNEITNETEFYQENELVAKADYMESSHLNNTPTAMFYNAMTTLQQGYDVIDSNDHTILILLNPTVNKLNAIEGIPIVLIINSVNYGSFMLNIGKTGKSIGFGSNGISLEGTSNDDNAGMSSRFDFTPSNTSVKDYIEGITDIDEESEVNEDFVEFLKGGLEYRYSAADVDDIGDDTDEYLRILKMWHWVYTNETYDRQKFEEMFNFDFCALYYIQMVVFGQTDNLGKNMMIDLFEPNGQWFVRPYDMDSQAGLENNGNDYLSPVIEISLEFVLDLATKNITSINYLNLQTPRFPYSSKTSNLWIRFYNNLKSDIETFYKYLRTLGYSAEAVISLCEKEVISKLGINQYNKDFLNKYLTNTLVDLQFAYGNRWFRFKDWILKRFDFCDTYFKYNHYDANTNGDGELHIVKYSIPLYLLYSYNNIGGDSETTTSWGMESRVIFNSITKLDMWFSPKYIIDDGGLFLLESVSSQRAFSSVSPRVKLNNLISYTGTWNDLINIIDLSENTYLQEMSVSNINTTSSLATIPNLIVNLTISDSSLIPDLSNFYNLETVTFLNCEGSIHLEDCRNLRSITISSGKNIDLTLTNCGSLDNYINLNNSSTIFNRIVFNGVYINYLNLSNLKFNLSFTNLKSYIKVVNLYYSTILNKELNITNLVANTLLLNSISEVKIITNEAKSYKYLGLLNSAITLWGTTANTFDGNYFTNINNTRMIENITDTVITQLTNNANNVSSVPFRLRNCPNILYVVNLNVNNPVNNLFAECVGLKSITNSNISANGSYMFYRCYNLLTLPTSGENSTITILDDDGSAMFHSCQKLTYNDIEKVLLNNIVEKYWDDTTRLYKDTEISGVSPTSACKLTKYNTFLYNKSYNADTLIDLSLYAFAITMATCFSNRSYGGDPVINKNTTNDVTITYVGKLSKLVTDISRIFSSLDNHKCIIDNPQTLLEDCLSLTNLDSSFAYQTYSKNDYFFEVPTIPNNPGLNFDRIFSGSRVDLTNLKDDGIVYFPSNVISCSSAFYGTTINEVTEVSTIFKNCTNLPNVTNCFRNCTNFTCNSEVNFSNNLASVNIAGIFASNPLTTVLYGFGGDWYSDPTALNYYVGLAGSGSINDNNRVGPYSGTILKLTSDTLNIVSTNVMRNVLEGAKLDNTNVLDITINISTENCIKICKGLTLNNPSDTDSKIKIGRLENIKYADEAFRNVSILNDIEEPISIPNSLVNAPYMFAINSVSLKSITRLPIGLNNCSQLKNINYMFLNCHLMNDVIPTNIDFFLPISVTNMDHLFDGCYRLHGGIPRTFIQTTESVIINDLDEEETIINKNKITSLIGTFASTSILYMGRAWLEEVDYELNISEMFPEVTNVEELFYYNTGGSGDLQKLNPQCFSKCTICNNLFNSAVVKIPINCNFTLATLMRFAFACAYPGASFIRGITNINISSKLKDMTGIFSAADNDSSYKCVEVEDNLNTLLALKRGTYTGMLYGYSTDLSKDEYKRVSSSRGVLKSGHAA